MAGREDVAPVGVHDPARLLAIPDDRQDSRRQQCALVQVEGGGDASGVGVDLGRTHVLRRRPGAGLLEQRQVDHGSRVAHGARVTVPVPDPANVTGLVNEPQVIHTGLTEPCTRNETGEPCADDQHLDVGVQWFALDNGGVGVLEQVGEATSRLEVLLVTVRTQALVPFRPVPGPKLVASQGFGRVHRGITLAVSTS